MAQRTHTYKIEKGDDVLPKWLGQEITLTQYTTVSEAIANGHAEGEAAIMAAFNRDRNIKANRVIRKALAKETGTLADAVAQANKVKVNNPVERDPNAPKTTTRVPKHVAAVVDEVEEITRNAILSDAERKDGKEPALKQVMGMLKKAVTPEYVAKVRQRMESERIVAEAKKANSAPASGDK